LITLGSSGNGDSPQPPSAAPAAPAPPPAATVEPAPIQPEPPAEPRSVALDGIAALDPDGDGREHDEQAAQATDGDPITYWATETYGGGLAKPGVGLVLDAGGPVSLTRITVTTDTPGFTAQVNAAFDTPSGPYTTISPSKTVTPTTSFSFAGRQARYYVIWITKLDRVAHINEVRGVRRTEAPR
jgi:hypothetical protein